MQTKLQKLLKKYKRLTSRLEDDDDSYLQLQNVPDKYALRMKDVIALQEGKESSIRVIEPQTYTVIFNLHRNSSELEHFYNHKGVACTGGGADRWVKVSREFYKWLKTRLDIVKEHLKTKKKKVKEVKPAVGTIRRNDKGVRQIYSTVTRWVNAE